MASFTISMILSRTVIFVSAFLLFLLQPIISKFILPWFGGAPSVWTSCLLFFQFVLLLGYLYAYLLSTRCKPKYQCTIHLVLVLFAVATIAIIPDESWKPHSDRDPNWYIILLLLSTVGLPFFVLTTTSPLIQYWWSLRFPGRSPYPLFSLSNLASLLALIFFPFIIEPKLNSRTQATLWGFGFVIFSILMVFTLLKNLRNVTVSSNSELDLNLRPSKLNIPAQIMWLLLSTTGTILLLAITNHITQDVAVIPLLWILPLIVYLISFVLCFHPTFKYNRRAYIFLTAVALIGLLTGQSSFKFPSHFEIALNLILLFSCCMFCHGELHSTKPDEANLTRYYLIISIGGALGSLFVAVIAPMIFTQYLEYPLGLELAILLTICSMALKDNWRFFDKDRPCQFLMMICSLALTTILITIGLSDDPNDLIRIRNFFGVIKIKELDRTNVNHRIQMDHGTTVHGFQFMSPGKRSFKTAYYGTTSGVGIVLSSFKSTQMRRVGLIGLGVGTLASYGNEGDKFKYYEINPAVVATAKAHFSYLADSNADVEIILGDARLSLEREVSNSFDIITLDAFSSDAIPVHLMTLEAFKLYLHHIAHDGIIVIHISNNHLDLAPVISAISANLGLMGVMVRDAGNAQFGSFLSTYIILARDGAAIKNLPFKQASISSLPISHNDYLWRDDYNNLFSILH